MFKRGDRVRVKRGCAKSKSHSRFDLPDDDTVHTVTSEPSSSSSVVLGGKKLWYSSSRLELVEDEGVEERLDRLEQELLRIADEIGELRNDTTR